MEPLIFVHDLRPEGVLSYFEPRNKLCYGDSDLVSFLVSVWGHLVKPGMF